MCDYSLIANFLDKLAGCSPVVQVIVSITIAVILTSAMFSFRDIIVGVAGKIFEKSK